MQEKMLSSILGCNDFFGQLAFLHLSFKAWSPCLYKPSRPSGVWMDTSKTQLCHNYSVSSLSKNVCAGSSCNNQATLQSLLDTIWPTKSSSNSTSPVCWPHRLELQQARIGKGSEPTYQEHVIQPRTSGKCT